MSDADPGAERSISEPDDAADDAASSDDPTVAGADGEQLDQSPPYPDDTATAGAARPKYPGARQPPRRTGSGDGPTQQDRWRRLGWVAVIAMILGVGWGLTLGTILIKQSGDHTSELISLFKSGQQSRQTFVQQIPQSQAERAAQLAAERSQAQMFKQQALTSITSQAQNNAQIRQALGFTALAGAQARQADAEASAAQAQGGAQDRLANAAVGQGNIEAQAQQRLSHAIDSLQSQLGALRDALGQAPAAAQGALRNAIAVLQAEIATLRADIGQVPAAARGALSNAIERLKGAIAALRAKIEELRRP